MHLQVLDLLLKTDRKLVDNSSIESILTETVSEDTGKSELVLEVLERLLNIKGILG